MAYCRGPYCVYADDAVRLLRSAGLEGAPAGCRLSRVAPGRAAGRDRELRRLPMLLRPFLNDARLVCELPVRLHEPRQARRRRPARRPGRRVPGRGSGDRLADRGRVRDARAGRPRLRAAGARRAHRRDRVSARRRGCRVRARRAGGRERGRARQHARDARSQRRGTRPPITPTRSPTGAAAPRSRGSCSAATRS